MGIWELIITLMIACDPVTAKYSLNSFPSFTGHKFAIYDTKKQYITVYTIVKRNKI